MAADRLIELFSKAQVSTPAERELKSSLIPLNLEVYEFAEHHTLHLADLRATKG
jgi:hypothetical protein